MIAVLEVLSLNRAVHFSAIIENDNLEINDLMELSFHHQKEIAFRAAWMLEHFLACKPEFFHSYIPDFLALLPRQKNPSAMRHYAKMVALMTDRKASEFYRQLVPDINFDSVIEILFIWLIDPKTLVAVKVHCMQSLANLSPHYDWIEEELMETIDHLTATESIAFFARAKMIKKQLKRVAR